jgi:hemolysin activation/secretion protein
MNWQKKGFLLWCSVMLPGNWLVMTASMAATLPDASTRSQERFPLEYLPEGHPTPSRFTLERFPQDYPTPDRFALDTLPPPATPVSQAEPPAGPFLQPLPERRPDDDRFLQPLPPALPTAPGEDAPVLPEETPPADTDGLPADGTASLFVQQINVTGSTIFDAEDFAPITAPVEGREATVEELRQVADQITQLYLDGGYITTRAVLVEQEVEAGVIEIRVIEGSLEAIEIEGNQRVNTSYIRSRVALGGRTPLNQGQLEDQLRLLRLDPLFENVEASLRAGTGLGQSILVVRVQEADPFFGSVGVDNYSTPSVGSERVGFLGGFRNVSGLGDQLTLSYYRSTTGGSNVYDVVYRMPVNPMNGTFQLRVAPSDFRITDPEFADILDSSGFTNEYELSFRQPFVRTPREEFALSLGFTYRDADTQAAFIGFPDSRVFGESTTSVFRFGQDYVRRDPGGAWAVRSQFSVGTSLFDATTDGTPNGEFFSWLGQLQRVQILNPDNLLIIQADVQLTPDALLASEQFAIGGGQSLRGYRQNARLGDNGFRLSVENRTTLVRDEAGAPRLQVAPFADIGSVWNDDSNPADLPDETFLAGVGLGVLWTPFQGMDVRLDYGVPLVYLDDRGRNVQDNGFYFSVNYTLP